MCHNKFEGQIISPKNRKEEKKISFFIFNFYYFFDVPGGTIPKLVLVVLHVPKFKNIEAEENKS